MPEDDAAAARADRAWEEFTPAGLRVLVVDDDKMCLTVIAKMLQQCSYDVVTSAESSKALSMLRDSNNHFDLVLSDVVMPDMDGFKLLEIIGLEMDIPVIMMSYDGDTNTVLKGVTHGAVDFLIKPVRLEELSNMWQHVVRKRKQQALEAEAHGDTLKRSCSRGDDSSGEGGESGEGREEGCSGEHKKRSKDDRDDRSNQPSTKRPRVHWSSEMHSQFVAAVNKLGIDKAVPKKILELMTVKGLTRENVASHLQKYRLYLKKAQGINGVPAQGVPAQPHVMMPTLPHMMNPHLAPAHVGHVPSLFPAMHPHGYVPPGAHWQTPMVTPAIPRPQPYAVPQHLLMGKPVVPVEPSVSQSPHMYQLPPTTSTSPGNSQGTNQLPLASPASTDPVKRESMDTMGGVSGGLSDALIDDVGVDIGHMPEEMDEFLSILAKDTLTES